MSPALSPTRPEVVPRVLVVGTGYVGRRFLAQQRPDGAIGISRTAAGSDQRIQTYDLDVGGPLPIGLQLPYKVLYTVPPAGSATDERLERLLREMQPLPSRFVYISTTGVYGDRGGATVDETAPLQPGNPRAQARVVAEHLVREWGAEHAVSVVILRVPGIYGPTRLGQKSLRGGQPVIDEEETGPGNRIHVDDLVACCKAALADRVPAGTYNVGDGDHRSPTWFKRELARQLGLPAPRSISMDEAARTFSPMALSFLRERRLVDTCRMRDILGVVPIYPDAADGIAASLGEEQGLHSRLE